MGKISLSRKRKAEKGAGLRGKEDRWYTEKNAAVFGERQKKSRDLKT